MKTARCSFLLFIIFSNPAAGQLPDPDCQLLKTESYTQSKNYYLLTLFQQLPDVNKLLSSDSTLRKIATAKRNYITDEIMQQRCMKELGYVPYKNGKRLSETEAEFYPLVTSLRIDTDEPMDP